MGGNIDPNLDEFNIVWEEVFADGVKEYTFQFQIESIEMDPVTGISVRTVLAYFEVVSPIVYANQLVQRDQTSSAGRRKKIHRDLCKAYGDAVFPAFHTILSEMSREDGFPYLLNALGLLGSAVEVGVRYGQFAETMLERWRGRRYIMVDPWRCFTYDEYPDRANEEQQKQDQAFESVYNKTQRYGAKSVMLRMTSLEAANLLFDQSIDFVYIDAQHGM
eukprot:gene2207-2637_t